jgi:hypothetical protein
VWGLAQPTASAFRRVVLLVMCAFISAVIGITQVRVGLFLSTPVNLTSNSVGGFRKYRKLNLLKVVERTSFT